MIRQRPTQQGFTLLEIMVTLLIVGILLGMATLSIGNDGGHRTIRNELRSLRQKMVLAAREAVINQQEFGLRLTANGYQFLLLDEKEQWQLILNDRVFRPSILPAAATLHLQVEGRGVELSGTSSGPAQLFFSSSGEQTPFQVELLVAGKKLFKLSGDGSGLLLLE